MHLAQACGHAPDARLATTLIRVCSQHGQALTALGLYDWMRAGRAAGGGSLTCTVFTYTAAMRAALAGGLLPRAFQVPRGNTSCKEPFQDCWPLHAVCYQLGIVAKVKL